MDEFTKKTCGTNGLPDVERRVATSARTSLVFVGDWLPRNRVDYSPFVAGGALVANLECAISDRPITSEKAYSIVLGTEAFTHVRESGFSAVNLANNHAMDAGRRSLEDLQRRILAETDLQCYGLRQRPIAELVIAGVRCAILGCMENCHSRSSLLFPEEAVDREVRRLRQCFGLVFVTPHWGIEGELACCPSPRQRRLARRWLAAGADGVFGHHSHTVQGHEVVDGKPIYYSLGNFDFVHAESAACPRSQLGLVVAVDVRQSRRSSVTFLSHLTGAPVTLLESEDAAARAYFEEVSRIVSDPQHPLTISRWARIIGPTYIEKSRRSWNRRLSQGPFLLTLLKRLVWGARPTTMLLWIASLHPDKTHLRIDELLSDALEGRQ